MQVILFFYILSISLLSGSKLNPNDTDLLIAFARLGDCPSRESQLAFVNLVKDYSSVNFTESVRLAHREGWKFRCAFFVAARNFPDLENIGKLCYSDTLDDMISVIASKLFENFYSIKKKKKHFEAIKLIFKVSSEIPIEIGKEAKRKIIALEFIYGNLSFDHSSKSIDYVLLQRTFRDISRLFTYRMDPKNPSQDLFNSCSLLAIQLSTIAENKCMEFFEEDSIRGIRPFLVFLILKLTKLKSPSKIYIRFMVNQTDCISKIISLLGINMHYRMRSLLNFTQSSDNPLSSKLKFRNDPKMFREILDLPMEEIKSFPNVSYLSAWELWELKGLIELHLFLKHYPHIARIK
jgi:hypothetical protein